MRSTPSFTSARNPRLKRQPKGVALVLVLTILSLLMVLILAMLSMSKNELTSATSFNQITEVRTLSELPVNIVMGQIREATSKLGTTKSWISQPGMIRVFGTEGNTHGRADLVNAYRLYSSDEMVADKTFDSSKEVGELEKWAEKRTLFTDLNEPVTIPMPYDSGSSAISRKVFPIMDLKVFDVNEDGKMDGGGDAETGIPGRVEGVSLAKTLPGVSEKNPLPMPVRWIYVTKDGRYAIPTDESKGEAQFNAGVVNLENPIVGRIAFWTDDESCKINLNTASEGVPWEMPRDKSWSSHNYASFQPAMNEFQRMPGHPATTSLSPVLSAFDEVFKYEQPVVASFADGTARYRTNPEYLKQIYQMLPRTNYGETSGAKMSSAGGTQDIGEESTGLLIKKERLFASVDEFFYQPNLDARRVRLPNGPREKLEAEDLDIARFFLTAHSRAPETNLFNRPRVSLWPLQSTDADRRLHSAKDRLIAFCSTVGNQEVAYHRAQLFQNAESPGSSHNATQDFLLLQNQRIFSYLQSLTGLPVPGYAAATFNDKYGANSRNQILFSMFDLQRWSLNPVYYAHTDGDVDIAKSYAYLPPRDDGPLANGSWQGVSAAAPALATTLPNGDLVPPGGLRGYGRFPTVVEVAVVFMATEVTGTDSLPYRATDAINPVRAPRDGNNDAFADETRKMRAFLILQPFTPAVGMPPQYPELRYKIKGLENWKADEVPLFRSPTGDHDNYVNHVTAGGASTEYGNAGPYTGLQTQFVYEEGNGSTGAPPIYAGAKTVPEDPAAVPNPKTDFPFAGLEVPITLPSGSSEPKTDFVFTGGDITIEIYSGAGDDPGEAKHLVQTITLNVPGGVIPMPQLSRKLHNLATPTSDWLEHGQLMNLGSRFGPVDDAPAWRSKIVRYGDIVRSVVVNTVGATKGDFRLLASQSNVPLLAADAAAYFVKHPSYDDPAQREAQSLRYGYRPQMGNIGRSHALAALTTFETGFQHSYQLLGNQINAGTFSKTYGLLKDVPYYQDSVPACAIRQDGAFNLDGRPGDWDNGFGRMQDGPYINKADDGSYNTAMSYFASDDALYTSDLGQVYSPNRQVSSAVMFGSLPSGVFGNAASPHARPWQTLLFSPNPASRLTGSMENPTTLDHQGFLGPKDHLLLDLYWMPIVEPYAISEPMSTAGKINMNTQIMPFSYIKRETGMHAALRSVRVTALPSALAWAEGHQGPGLATPAAASNNYKAEGVSAMDMRWMPYETRYNVNVKETLRAFTKRFEEEKDVFRSASEICDIFLVPEKMLEATYYPGLASTNPTYDTMVTWWNGSLESQKDGMELTGDNSREAPYNQLYPRLTTRSNTFQVHYRVQVLKKSRSTGVSIWNEAKDIISADHRGSVVLERYLDPNDREIPNLVEKLDAEEDALDDHYRFRIIRKKQFAP